MQKVENDINKNAKIAVLCGGLSTEKEISMRSGKGCFEALQRLGYKNAEMVVVDEDIAPVSYTHLTLPTQLVV